MEDCRTPLAVQTRGELETYVLGKYDMFAGAVYNTIAKRTKGRVPAGFDAEQWVQDAYRKALDKLDALPDEPEAHAEFLETWCRPGYFARVAANAATDHYRKIKDELLILEEHQEFEPSVDPRSVADVAVENVTRERQARALWSVFRTLIWRAGAAGATSLSQAQFETLQAYGDAGVPIGSDGPVDDETLHAEAIRRNQRARETWVRERVNARAGRTVAHHDGLKAATARALEVTEGTVKNRLNQAARAVRFTRYVVGVLGHRYSLQHSACITWHLNVADALPAAGYAAEHALLSVAADHVHTTEQNGTRVDPASYLNAGASTVDELHDAETLYADRAHSTWPNCVAICTPHTLNGWTSRATEF